MGWSWALACSCAFLLVFLCTASEDGPDMGQREVTFDEIMQGVSLLEPDMSQKMVDLDGLWEPIEFPDMEQREITIPPLDPDLLKALMEKDRPVFGPRSFGKPEPVVLFPPGQPSPSNLQAICLSGNRRPRYLAHSLPRSGFSHLSRQGDAVNRAESWYSVCCRANGTQEQAVTLCCVRQAWEQSISQFCEDEFSVKTRHHHCCKKEGGARLSCFHSEAPNPAYLPTNQGPETLTPPEPGFTFNPNTCQRSGLSPRSFRLKKPSFDIPATPRKSDISFPPGRPTSANIQLVCRLRKLRPLYLPKCLPRTGYGWLARQSKAVNRLEKGLKRCCKGQEEVLPCADSVWREVIHRFCQEEKDGSSSQFSCCEIGEGEERYNCFSARAPHPGYNRELLSTPAPPQAPTLGQICETHKIIRKKFPVGLPIQSLVNKCCPLPSKQRTRCVQEKLLMLSKTLCSAKKPSSPSSPAVSLQCCPPSPEDSPKCLSRLLMDAITKATKSSRLRKRKCPLS